MKRAVVAVLVFAAGCSTELERGRYQCDPTLDGGEGQCPGASRCGLEGYCHNAGDVSVAWRCLDRNNCENGYECGLAEGRTYRECHDPDAPDAAYACAVSADCVRNWHCGVDRRCYDRGVGAAYPCRPDAGVSDCADQWRCGLDRVCHDTRVAGPYPCARDTDCEQQWRCGLDGLCLDPARDALRAVTAAVGPAEKVSPLLLDHPPEHLAASPVQSPAFNQPRQFIAWADRGQIQVLDLQLGGAPPVGGNPHRLQTMPDAGEVVAIATLGAKSLDRFAAEDLGSWTYVARPDGRFEELHFRTTVDVAFNGTPWRNVLETEGLDPVSDYFAPTALGVGTTEPGYVPTLHAYRRGAAIAPSPYFYGWGARSTAQFINVETNYSDVANMGPTFAVPGNFIRDLAIVTAHDVDVSGSVGQADCVLIADARGLSVQQARIENSLIERFRPWPVMVPPFTNDECAPIDENGVPQNYRFTGLATSGRDWVAVSVHPMDAGVEVLTDDQVALINVSNWWEVRTAGSFFFTRYRGCNIENVDAKCKKAGTFLNPIYPVKADTVLGPCRVCENERLVMVAPVSIPGGGMKLEVRCRDDGADGGSAVDHLVDVSSAPGMGAACFRVPHPLTGPLATDPVVLSSSNSGERAFAGPRGHLWVGSSAARAVPVFFDKAPAGAFAGPTGEPTFFAADRIGWSAPGFGLLAFPLSPQDGDRPVASVAGSPKAFVGASGLVLTFDQVAPGGPARILAPRDPLTTRFDAPHHALAAGPYIVVSAGDSVFAANTTAANRALRRRIIPAEGKEILGLVYLPGPGPLTLHALTRSAVYRITAVSEQQWTSVAAALPAGEPVALWADGSRGRIGYADGRVFALETLVQIGNALPAPADAFTALCGQAFALAGGTAYRLTAGATAIGEWKPVTLADGLPPSELDDGALMPFTEPDAGTSVYVFSRRGEVVRAPVAACPQ